eukprot:Partr_v1_DN25762_c0_g1_i2_m74700 putative Inherit from opiNOG: Glycosyltransferase-like
MTSRSNPGSPLPRSSSAVDLNSLYRRYSPKRFTTTDFLPSMTGFSRYIKALFVLYIVVSLLYTLVHFYSLFQANYGIFGSSSSSSSRTVVGKFVLDGSGRTSTAGSDGAWTGRFSAVMAADGSGEESVASVPFDDVTDSMLYSKMFQYALQPTRVVPYFFRMSSRVRKDDITISTIITMERLSVFNNLVIKYKGPISVAVHIPDDEEKLAAIEQLHKFYRNNPFFAEYVDLHLVVDAYDRQFNYWRNVARFFARSDLIMMIDVDFLLCSDLRYNFEQLDPVYKERVNNGSAVFVVPAFEFTNTAADLEVVNYPETKSELKKYYTDNGAIMFHNNWRRGHGPTDYDKWFDGKEPYKVSEYNYNYEPYVLMKREGLPWCDERFVGYGSNKAACLYEIFLAGVEFWVMPEDFLVHQRHPYPENDRRVEVSFFLEYQK